MQQVLSVAADANVNRTVDVAGLSVTTGEKEKRTAFMAGHSVIAGLEERRAVTNQIPEMLSRETVKVQQLNRIPFVPWRCACLAETACGSLHVTQIECRVPYAVRGVWTFLKEFGCTLTIIEGDGEPLILALAIAIQKEWAGDSKNLSSELPQKSICCAIKCQYEASVQHGRIPSSGKLLVSQSEIRTELGRRHVSWRR